MFLDVLFYFNLLTKYISGKKWNLLLCRIDCICNRACYSKSHSTCPLVDYIELAENSTRLSSSEHLTAGKALLQCWHKRIYWKWVIHLNTWRLQKHSLKKKHYVNDVCRILNTEKNISYWLVIYGRGLMRTCN